MTGLQILKPLDVLFLESPDVGEPGCICSRCLQRIERPDLPIRVFVDEGRGGEYRFHPRCVGFAS